jgi:hypothetical protein
LQVEGHEEASGMDALSTGINVYAANTIRGSSSECGIRKRGGVYLKLYALKYGSVKIGRSGERF